MVLAEIFNTKDNQSIQLSFKEPWTNMERVDKIETLISIEKEIAGMRKELRANFKYIYGVVNAKPICYNGAMPLL